MNNYFVPSLFEARKRWQDPPQNLDSAPLRLLVPTISFVWSLPRAPKPKVTGNIMFFLIKYLDVNISTWMTIATPTKY